MTLECTLIDQKHNDILPQNTFLKLPKDGNVFALLLHTIRTENSAILKKILETLPYSQYRVICCKYGINSSYSEAIIRAVQRSDEFKNFFLSWQKSDFLEWSYEGSFEIFNEPVDRLIGIVRIDLFRNGPLKFQNVEQFERLMQIYEFNNGLDNPKKTILNLYSEIVENSDLQDPESLLFFYQANLAFFHCWIRSQYWKKLSYIDEVKIYDYMESDFPRRIRKIRLLRANSIVQENNSMDIEDNDQIYYSYQNQSD